MPTPNKSVLRVDLAIHDLVREVAHREHVTISEAAEALIADAFCRWSAGRNSRPVDLQSALVRAASVRLSSPAGR